MVSSSAVAVSPAGGADSSTATNTSPEAKIDYDQSLSQLQKAFALFPYNQGLKNDLASAYRAVGHNHMQRKQYDEAAESFSHAAELFPERQEYAVLQGIALYLAKRYDEAAYKMEQARLQGETVELLFFFGRLKYDTGNLAEALDVWEKALALDPGNKSIVEMIHKARREATVESSMGKGFRSMFVISYDEGTMSDLADEVLKALESAYNRVGSDFSYYPSVRIPVILYTGKDYRNVTAGPEWSGGMYDGKVRLPIGGIRELTPMLRGVLSHEYTHVVVRELTKGNCPIWLNEGLAEVEGRAEYDPPLTALMAAAKGGNYLPFGNIEASLLAMTSKEAQLAYQQSYSLVKYMISSYGWFKVREILVSLGNGMNIDDAIAKAFADFGMDYNILVQEWEMQVRKEHEK